MAAKSSAPTRIEALRLILYPAVRRTLPGETRVPRGSPTLSVVFSCPTKDGKYAAAHIHGPANSAVQHGEQAKMVDSAALRD